MGQTVQRERHVAAPGVLHGGAGQLGVDPQHRVVEKVSGLGHVDRVEAAAPAEGQAPVGREAPVKQKVLGVHHHPPGGADASGQLLGQDLGGDDVAADRHHLASQVRRGGIGVGVGGQDHVGGIDAAPRGRHPVAPPASAQAGHPGAVDHPGTGVHGPGGQAGVKPGRVQPAGAVEDDPAVKRLAADLRAQVAGLDKPDGLAQGGVFGRLVAQLVGVRWRMGQVQLTVPDVVAVDAGSAVIAGDGGLDEVERLVRLGVQAGAQLAVVPLEAGRPGLELGDHHAAVAAGGAPTERLAVEHHHRASGNRQRVGGGQAAQPGADDDDVDRGRQVTPGGERRRHLCLPQPGFGVAGSKQGRHVAQPTAAPVACDRKPLPNGAPPTNSPTRSASRWIRRSRTSS